MSKPCKWAQCQNRTETKLNAEKTWLSAELIVVPLILAADSGVGVGVGVAAQALRCALLCLALLCHRQSQRAMLCCCCYCYCHFHCYALHFSAAKWGLECGRQGLGMVRGSGMGRGRGMNMSMGMRGVYIGV